MQLKPALGVALRIKLYHLQLVGGDKRRKADEMLLDHRMVKADELFILDIFDDGAMRLISVKHFRRLDGNAAAAKLDIAKRVNNISADGTDVKL